MTGRPIIFSAPMIRAILREIDAPGTGKTQTRRVMKLPVKGVYKHPKMSGWAASTIGGAGCYLDPAHTIPAPERPCVWHQTTGDVILPSVEVGDRLWVREAFRGSKNYDTCPPHEWSRWPVHYNTDGPPPPEDDLHMNGRLRPSIHMPRWASRLTLTVTDVRVQQLQDISEDDARAEGAPRCVTDGDGAFYAFDDPSRGTHKCGFAGLWDSLNAKRAPWGSNPWVAAITFTPRLGNIDSEYAGLLAAGGRP